ELADLLDPEERLDGDRHEEAGPRVVEELIDRQRVVADGGVDRRSQSQHDILRYVGGEKLVWTGDRYARMKLGRRDLEPHGRAWPGNGPDLDRQIVRCPLHQLDRRLRELRRHSGKVKG